MKNLTKTFIEIKTGECVDENNPIIKRIDALIRYLYDNNIDEPTIYSILNSFENIESISQENLPESLWEGSLLKKNTFYFHDSLRLISAPPKWNPITLVEEVEPYYLEMKIRYTIDDLLEYFYKTLLIPVELREYSKDKGAMEYLLRKYKVMDPEPIDFILFMIDKAKYSEDIITGVFDLKKYEYEINEMFKKIFRNKTINKSIIWRK